jgi:predicted XRE-type DNA-binding protein
MMRKATSRKTGSREDAGQPIPVTRGSGNVFADLGLPNPEERLAKAQLAHAIQKAIDERGLTQREAAALMGVDQPKVSHILRGRLADFSTERLMKFLTGLGCDVEIVIKPSPRSRKKGRLRVAAA